MSEVIAVKKRKSQINNVEETISEQVITCQPYIELLKNQLNLSSFILYDFKCSYFYDFQNTNPQFSPYCQKTASIIFLLTLQTVEGNFQ